jgi:CRP-like cAMP-binding protein
VDRVPLPFPSIRELLSGFSESESGSFHSLCIERRFPRDAEVFRQGDPPDGVCIVKKGLLKIVSLSEKGTEQILHILGPETSSGSWSCSESLVRSPPSP